MIRDLLYPSSLSVSADIYHAGANYALDLQGWSSTSLVFERVIAGLKPKVLIEVGVWKGCSTVVMAQHCLNNTQDFEIVAIDTFLGCKGIWFDCGIPRILGKPILFDIFLSNICHLNLQKFITPFPMDSTNAALILQELGVRADLIYIDGSHDYTSVSQDLRSYLPLLRSGGILLGDDADHPPVNKAFNDVLGNCEVYDGKFVYYA